MHNLKPMVHAVEARRKGVDLNVFKLEDYGINYGYSPLLVAHPETLRSVMRHALGCGALISKVRIN